MPAAGWNVGRSNRLGTRPRGDRGLRGWPAHEPPAADDEPEDQAGGQHGTEDVERRRPAPARTGCTAQDAGRGPVGAPSAPEPYHRRVFLPAPWLLAVALVLGLVVLLPARRLQLAGLSGRSIGSYALCLWLLAFAVLVRPGVTRFLIPILIIAYVAPFVAGPERIARVARRGRRRPPPSPPIKNVTPPSDRIDGGPSARP